VSIHPTKLGLTLLAAILSCTTLCLGATTAHKAPVVVAQASPRPTATPNPLTYSGYVRAFYFNRENASQYLKGIGQVNQTSFNAALRLHADYHLGSTPLSLGATYVGANPLGVNGACDDTANYGQGGSCQQYPSTNALERASDTTLPGFGLSTLAEAYLQYKDKHLYAKIGDQLFNSPWANASDSRVKAVYFQGADVKVNAGGGWSIGLTRMTQWQSRVSSAFNKSTLLTINSNGSIKPTDGFLLGDVAYAHAKDFSADVNLYQYYDLGQMVWAEGKWNPMSTSKLNPFVALQYGSESDIGARLLGTIASSVLGFQVGVNLTKSVSLAASYDDVPLAQRAMTLPAGVTCGVSSHLLSASAGFFLPTSGTPDCLPGATPGTATIYYGGLASPYTDSYATDPLFTTSISQGMADRRSPGNSGKIAATFVTDDKHFKFVVSRAFYDYTNPAGSETTYETNLDGTYFLSKSTGAAYHGFSIRDRYAERTQSFTEIYGGLPIFKYNRAQLEYDF
jgi:hypothetical protein